MVCVEAGTAGEDPSPASSTVGINPSGSDLSAAFREAKVEGKGLLKDAVQQLLRCPDFADRLWASREQLFMAGGVPQALMRVLMKAVLARSEEGKLADLTVSLSGLQVALDNLHGKYNFGKISQSLWW